MISNRRDSAVAAADDEGGPCQCTSPTITPVAFSRQHHDSPRRAPANKFSRAPRDEPFGVGKSVGRGLRLTLFFGRLVGVPAQCTSRTKTENHGVGGSIPPLGTTTWRTSR